MSRMTNFILLSFTILQKVDDILSSKGQIGAQTYATGDIIVLNRCQFNKYVYNYLLFTGNHTVPVRNGRESRQTLEESFRYVFLEANKIIDDGFIEIDGKKVGVDIYLGADHKVS